MNDATLYSNSNNYQRVTVQNVLNESAPLLHWRKDGRDSVLDIGCGSGDVTVELILPILPPQFCRLVGCDLSDEMLKYARQHYHQPQVVFEKQDIRESVDDLLEKFGPFDRIFSFFCLHWVKDQAQALRNIHKLLAPEGECLLMFVASSNTFVVYHDMSKTEKWSKYMTDVELYIPRQQYMANPVDDFQELCKSVGFTVSNIQVRETTYVCAGFEEYKNFYQSINPFVKRVPVNEQEDFVTEYTERLMALYKEQNYDTEYLKTAKVLIVYAKK